MAAAVEIPSDWQIKCPEIRQRTSQLYQLGLWTDCVFRVGAEAASVSAHRLILAIASPVFEAIFYGALALNDNVQPIDVPDTQVEAFKAMLEYIYTDEVTIPSCTVAYEVFDLGQKYMLPKLRAESIQYLQRNIAPDNVGFIYQFAQVFDEEQLANQCLEVIKSNTLKVLESDSFPELQIETVVKIFTLEPLNIGSELDLYDAAVKYTTYNKKERVTLKQDLEPLFSKLMDKPVDKIDTVATELEPDRTKTEDIDSTVEVKTNEDDAKAKISDAGMKCKCNHSEVDRGDTPELPIRKAVKHIRFLTVYPHKFSQRDFRTILTQSEILAITLNLMSKWTHMPMPSGFSTDRKSRMQKESEDAEYETTVFRMIVNDISRIEDHESPVFYVRNLPCQIDIKTMNKEGQKQLDVFLYCNWDDESTWSCHLHVTFRLISSTLNISPICSEFEYEFGNPGDTNQGFGDFIPWDELMAPENGYVIHDSIFWEVEIRAGRVKREVTAALPSP